MLLAGQGEPWAACDWFDRAAEVLSEVLEREPRHLQAREFLRMTYADRAEGRGRLGRHAEALADYDRALGLAEGEDRSLLRLGRAGALARLGEHARATSEASAVAESTDSGAAHYSAACAFALAAASARDDAALSRGDREALAERYASRALALLDSARRSDYFGDPAKLEALETGPDLEAIRSLAAFRALVQDAKFPGDPFAR
jgi:hypothetical protein